MHSMVKIHNSGKIESDFWPVVITSIFKIENGRLFTSYFIMYSIYYLPVVGGGARAGVPNNLLFLELLFCDVYLLLKKATFTHW